MIRVLIVDDNADKINDIKETVKSTEGKKKIKIEIAKNIKNASQKLSKVQYHLVVLDLNISLSENGNSQPDGGLRLLNNLKNQNALIRPFKLIGLTAHNDCYDSYNVEFVNEGYLLVKYSNSDTEWQKPICNSINLLSFEVTAPSMSVHELFLAYFILFIIVVSVFLPINYSYTQSTQLFLLSSFFIALLFGKNIQSRFKLKLPGLLFTTTGATAVVLGTFMLLNKVSSPELAFSVYEILDENGEKIILEMSDIHVPIGQNSQRPEIFIKGHSILATFPSKTHSAKIDIKGYSGTMHLRKDKVQTLQFGKQLKK